MSGRNRSVGCEICREGCFGPSGLTPEQPLGGESRKLREHGLE